jgi:hypothetical protein
MRHPTRAGIGLIRLGDSDFVPANPEDDVRGKDVYDAEGQRIGSVEDLYIERTSRVPATPKREVTKAATAEASPADTTWVGGTVLLTSSNVAAGFCHRLLLTVYRT